MSGLREMAIIIFVSAFLSVSTIALKLSFDHVKLVSENARLKATCAKP